MSYENRIVCFLDILGFKNTVLDKVMSADEIETLFSEIRNIVNDYKEDGIQISHFSDSIIISIARKNTAPTQLRFIRDILIKLLENKLLARGAMVFGEIIHTHNHVFGPALVKAVELEKKEAKFPRIILDNSLDEGPLPTGGNVPINYRNYFNDFFLVKIDCDGEYYIDFIGAALKLPNQEKLFLVQNIKDLIRKNINVACLYEKYNWLEKKLDAAMPPNE